MRLTAARVSDHARVHRAVGVAGKIQRRIISRGRVKSSRRTGRVAVGRTAKGIDRMIVRRHFLRHQRVTFFAGSLPECESAAGVQGDAPPQIRQGEIRLPVSAVSRSQK